MPNATVSPYESTDSRHGVSSDDPVRRTGGDVSQKAGFAAQIERIIWFNLLVVTITPILSLYGLLTTRVNYSTVVFCISYYIFNMIGKFLEHLSL
jgi:hypothetical protein